VNGNIRIVKHEAVADTGSFEVRFFDGRPSRFFYWDDEMPARAGSGSFRFSTFLR